MGFIAAQQATELILDLKRPKRKREISRLGVNPRAHQDPIGLNIASDRPIWLQINQTDEEAEDSGSQIKQRIVPIVCHVTRGANGDKSAIKISLRRPALPPPPPTFIASTVWHCSANPHRRGL